jgi:uroporphyrinogen decarboxylase
MLKDHSKKTTCATIRTIHRSLSRQDQEMTSRERVLAALNHRQPDKVPIDFGGHRSSGIAAMAYSKFRAALRLPPRTIRVYKPVQQLAIIDDDVLDRFQVDTIELGRGFALDDRCWADWTLPDVPPENVIAMFDAANNPA